MTTRVLHHGLKEKIAVVYIQDPVRGLHTLLITEGVRDSSLHEFYLYFRANFSVDYGGKYKGPRN